MSSVFVIGSGFSGLSSACYLAAEGHPVTVVEKNATVGGRARTFREAGFLFDMGPSWYWMPDIFENFFQSFGHAVSDYYTLKKLDPGFQICFGKGERLSVPANQEELYQLFESIEKGSAARLRQFLQEGEFKYRLGMQQLAYQPALSWKEFARYDVISGVLRSHMFKSVKNYVRRFFKDPHLIALLEFPVLFLGAKPGNIPALYSLMNYSALVQGTYYPMGGMSKITEAMKSLAESLGVQIVTDCSVEKIVAEKGQVSGLQTSKGFFPVDAVIASADYQHVEQKLLSSEWRNYGERYWEKKTFAPSCLIFYVGVNKRIPHLLHHNLFFDADFERHAAEIYDMPQWPSDPLFYVCCPSKTDDSVAPPGMENLFILVPIATGIEDSEEQRESYFTGLIRRMEAECGEAILSHIVYRKSYCLRDFQNDYNAFRGNAYGLANTLRQTAVLKPSVRNHQMNNLFYAGQLTVPGPGVPPALISGRIAAMQALNYLNTTAHEKIIR